MVDPDGIPHVADANWYLNPAEQISPATSSASSDAATTTISESSSNQ